jgi:hypothetical protein
VAHNPPHLRQLQMHQLPVWPAALALLPCSCLLPCAGPAGAGPAEAAAGAVPGHVHCDGHLHTHQRDWLLAPRHCCNSVSSVVAQRAQHNRRQGGVLTGLASEHKRIQLNKSMLERPRLRCKLLHWQPWLSAATSRKEAG